MLNTQNDDIKLMQKSVQQLNERFQTLVEELHLSGMAEYVQLMNRPKKLIARSLLSGIARGVGIAIGVTVFLVFTLYVLRALGALNLPVIGDFIADIVEIVQFQLEGRRYY